MRIKIGETLIDIPEKQRHFIHQNFRTISRIISLDNNLYEVLLWEEAKIISQNISTGGFQALGVSQRHYLLSTPQIIGQADIGDDGVIFSIFGKPYPYYFAKYL